MKKIINGKRYDTETAKHIGYDCSDLLPRDFGYWEETLYVKRTGEFFLYGEGGPMTRYAESLGNNGWTGGEEIIPLTPEKARAWAEEHLSADEYEGIFGEVAEDESKKIVTYSLPVATIEKIKKLSVERRISFSDVVAAAVESLLKEAGRKMTKYYVTDAKAEGDEFTVAVTEDKEKAIAEAREHWASLTAHDKKRSRVEIRVYVEDAEDEDCTCFDYNTVEW